VILGGRDGGPTLSGPTLPEGTANRPIRIARTWQRPNISEFLAFLKQVANAYPAGAAPGVGQLSHPQCRCRVKTDSAAWAPGGQYCRPALRPPAAQRTAGRRVVRICPLDAGATDPGPRIGIESANRSRSESTPTSSLQDLVELSQHPQIGMTVNWRGCDRLARAVQCP